MKNLFWLLMLLGLMPSAFADCYPIRNIMSPAARQNFQSLCRAAVSCDPACQGIEPSKLINCSGTQDSNRLLAGGNIARRLLSCARAFFVDSMVDLANTIIELIKTLVGATISSATNIIRFMTDSDFRAQAINRGSGMSSLASSFLSSAVRNFSREYSANFRSAVGRVGLLQAPLAAIGETLLQPFLKMVVDVTSQIAESQISQFRCLNSRAKLDSLCALAGGFLMPPAVFFSVLKAGAAGIRGVRGIDSFMTAARRTFAARTRPPALTVGRAAPPPPRRVAPPPPRRVTPPPPPRRPAARPEPAPRRGGDPDGGLVDTPEEVVEVAENAVEGAGLVDDAVMVSDEVTDALRAERRAETAVDATELARVGRLADDARLLEAETHLGPLSADMRAAILDAHYVGLRGADGQMLPEALRRGFGTYTFADIRQKRFLLSQAGFSREQIRILMERGIAGAPANLAETTADVNIAMARRDAILAGDSSRLRLEDITDDRGRVTRQPTATFRELEMESYVAARGLQRIALEAEGDVARDAARRAVDMATTSGDPTLVLESADMLARRGGDMGLVVRDNTDRLTTLRSRLRTDPNNRALQSEIFSREALDRRYRVVEAPAPRPVVETPPVVAPVRVTPLVRATGEFISPAAEKNFLESIRGTGEASRDALATIANVNANPPLFTTVNKVFETYFNGNTYPDVAKAIGRRSGTLAPAEELRLLQALRQNFFRAQVTTRGASRTLAQEYKDRAWGGNFSNFERAERNLNDRIRELGGAP